MSEFELVSLIYLIGGIIYLIPSIVAFRPRNPNLWLILVLNIVFGGTGIGWLGCIVWAFHAAQITKDPDGSRGGESGRNLMVNDPVRITFDPASRPASSIDDRIGQLERLKRLRDDAVIDQPEFARLAQEVLNPPHASCARLNASRSVRSSPPLLKRDQVMRKISSGRSRLPLISISECPGRCAWSSTANGLPSKSQRTA